MSVRETRLSSLLPRFPHSGGTLGSSSELFLLEIARGSAQTKECKRPSLSDFMHASYRAEEDDHLDLSAACREVGQGDPREDHAFPCAPCRRASFLHSRRVQTSEPPLRNSRSPLCFPVFRGTDKFQSIYTDNVRSTGFRDQHIIFWISVLDKLPETPRGS